ncbi:MAG TPA: flagellar hook-basal body complex protein FliE [Anaeromyxobacteraceae bacterium]|nr:flagellar hook-basal body complex protein FliE [Anaeromyxobacteraceae bacterium]
MAPITVPAIRTADLRPLDGARPLAPGADGGGSFADALGQALQSVDRLQVDADRDAQAVALGGGNLHETALALEKADVAMKLAVKVRNKLVEAYQDVMRMSV